MLLHLLHWYASGKRPNDSQVTALKYVVAKLFRFQIENLLVGFAFAIFSILKWNYRFGTNYP